MTIKEIQEELVEDFGLFDDWDDKYAYIIELGKKMASFNEKYKNEEYRVKGCQSNVWLNSYLEEGKVFFEADSDALIVKGLVSMLIKVLSGHSPEELAKADLYFIDKIGMKQHLSMTRANGLAAMIKKMKMYGIAYQGKTNV